MPAILPIQFERLLLKNTIPVESLCHSRGQEMMPIYMPLTTGDAIATICKGMDIQKIHT